MATNPGYGPIVSEVVSAVLGPGRCFPDVPPDVPPSGSFVIYQNVGGVPSYFSEGAVADKRNARVQLSVWATSPRTRYEVADALLGAFAARPETEPLTETIDDYEEILKLYGSRFDVAVWYPRFIP
ncbi:tail completion protein gp17 [Xanthomonas translucens]|uniref:tail completion protein gp17 n=1 Tax=Xanthomonas campestris pv. translucens TaxID=343 RepID=UPI00071E6BAA|nr:DUF3168 domain-containing protein [Xanthomonas translucens]